MSKRRETREQFKKQSEQASKSFEKGLTRFTRAISAGIDNLLFSKRWTFLISLLIAVIFFIWVRSSSNLALNIQSNFTDEAVPVQVTASTEIYEIIGVPETVQAMVSGSMVDVTTTRNQGDYYVSVDLTGLDAGVHSVRLVPEGFSPNVTVFLNPSDVRVTIREKRSQNFLLNYEFINTNQIDPQYVLGTPELDLQEVTVRASQETLDEIATVKALIDVSERTESFSTQAMIAAYDQQGRKMDIDLIPNTVNATVEISSPSKQIPLLIRLVGHIPNQKAIETLELEREEITIFGPENVLIGINDLVIPINAQELVDDGSLIHTINLPSGVRKADVNRVEVTYTLGDRITTTIEDVVVFVENNPLGFQVVLSNQESLVVDVEVSGTQSQIGAMDLSRIRLFIDINRLTEGLHTLPLELTSPYPLLEINPVVDELEVEIK